MRKTAGDRRNHKWGMCTEKERIKRKIRYSKWHRFRDTKRGSVDIY